MKTACTILTALLGSLQFVYAQLNLQWQEIGPDNFGGFVTGLIIDNRDATRQTLYAGTLTGGVWKSTNGGDWWEPLNCMESMEVMCIAQAANGTVYIGTGSTISGSNGSSFYMVNTPGKGIYKLDNNDTPVHLSATAATGSNSPWATGVSRIAINPQNGNHIVATTLKGIYRTTDAGNSWNEIQVNGITNGQAACDVKWSANGQNVFAVGGGNNKLIRSTDGGNTWERIINVANTGFPTTQGRIEVAIAPSNSNVVYIQVATSSGNLHGVYKSTDAGTTWDTVLVKSNSFDPFSSNNQGWFDNAITVMPNDPDKILVGGVNLYSYSPATGAVKLNPFVANYITTNTFVEQFQYVVNEQNPDEMYVATTEGVFKSYNTNSAFANFNVFWKSAGMRAAGFYSVGAAKNGTVMGGSNEVGTLISTPGSKNFSYLHKGIGFAEFSHLNPNVLFVEDYFAGLRRSADGGQTFDVCFDTNIDPQSHGQPSRCGGQLNGNADFIAPFVLHETTTAYNTIDSVSYTANINYNASDSITAISTTASTPFKYALPTSVAAGQTIKVPDPVKSRLFLATNCGGWVRTKALQYNIVPNTWFRYYYAANSGRALCFAVTENGNTVYTGTAYGRVIRTSGFNTASFTNVLMNDSLQQEITVIASGRSIEGIAVDRNNDNHVICAVAGYSQTNQPNLYKSTNGGLNWTPIQVGPNRNPAYTCVIDQSNSNRYIVGTEKGIWTSTDAGATWQQESSLMCDVPVYRLRQISLVTDNCPVLYAATQSRGLWRSFTLTPSGCNTSVDINEPTQGNDLRLKIYPNPSAEGQVNIQMAAELLGGTLQVFDATGKLMTEQIISDETLQLNTFLFSKGLYIVTASGNGHYMYSKLLVK